MDSTEIIPHDWPSLIRLLIVGLLGYGANTIPALLRRKQSAAETRKLDAEARQIDGTLVLEIMKTASQAYVEVERLTRKVEFQQARADRLQSEKEDAHREKEAVELERDILQKQLDDIIRVGKNK